MLTPFVVASATLLGRRFGQRVAGWLIAFPFTSAPVSLFLALERGTEFAAQAAIGSVLSVVALAAFAVAYRSTPRDGPFAGATLGGVAFAFAAAALAQLSVPLPAAVVVAAAALVFALRLFPRATSAVARAIPPPAWDLPARTVVTTALVLGLTTAAPLLGPVPSGLLASYPLYATVLAVFAERAGGRESGLDVIRGLILGMFGFLAFFVVLAALLEPFGVVAAFCASLAALAIAQTVSLSLLRRST